MSHHEALSAHTTRSAQWTKNPTTHTTVTVTFNGGDSGTGSMANETFTIGVAQAPSANGFVQPVHTFANWDIFAKRCLRAGPGRHAQCQHHPLRHVDEEPVMTVTILDVLKRPYGADDGVVDLGVSNDNRSTFLPHTPTISKDDSNTTVSESASNAAVGSEGLVLFTVNIASNFEAFVPVGESVTIHVGSSSCTTTTNGSGNGSSLMSSGALASGNSSVRGYAGYSNITITNAAGTTSETFELVVTA